MQENISGCFLCERSVNKTAAK